MKDVQCIYTCVSSNTYSHLYLHVVNPIFQLIHVSVNLIAGMTCHRDRECKGNEFPAPGSSVSTCCASEFSSIKFSAAGGTCQPCISKCVCMCTCPFVCTCTVHPLLSEHLWTHLTKVCSDK